MKKLYAIRNRETGEIYRHTYVPIYGTYWGAENHIRESLDSEKYEPVTLRIELTEPCEYCRGNAKELVDGDTTIFINHEDKVFYADWSGNDYLDWKHCPMCGRSLT